MIYLLDQCSNLWSKLCNVCIYFSKVMKTQSLNFPTIPPYLSSPRDSKTTPPLIPILDLALPIRLFYYALLLLLDHGFEISCWRGGEAFISGRAWGEIGGERGFFFFGIYVLLFEIQLLVANGDWVRGWRVWRWDLLSCEGAGAVGPWFELPLHEPEPEPEPEAEPRAISIVELDSLVDRGWSVRPLLNCLIMMLTQNHIII